MRLASCLLLIGACTPADDNPDPPDVEAIFDPGSVGFFDTPWPSDARLTADGAPNWLEFPNPADIAVFDTFLQRASERPGFGFNAPVYVRFDAKPPVKLLPTREGSTDPEAAVQIVDITPWSPTFGERTPVRTEFREDAGNYVERFSLAVAPVPGFPLRPRTTYAFVATTELAAPAAAFSEAFSEDGSGPWADALRPLLTALPHVDLVRERIAIASVFTTGDPTEELATIARFLDERVDPPTFTSELEHLYDVGSYRAYRADYTTPLFMEGDKPYAQEGGRFRFREDDGMPLVQAWDLMRMSVVVPDGQRPPPGGWPVLVYLHGTGGDYRGFADSDTDFEVGQWIAEAGAVGIGIDLPIHGARGTIDTIVELHTFNVLQPDSAINMHRQGAIDLMYLVKGLAEGVTFVTPDGDDVPLSGDRIALMGHSQGGITGALALPFMRGRVAGSVLSGAGGLLAITAVERDSDFDFPALIKSLLEFADDEELTELHPVLAMVQAIVEPTDPINYARYWFHEDGGFAGGTPANVLLTSGELDLQTPTRTAEALATAAHLPFAGKKKYRAASMTLRGFGSEGLPQVDNVTAWDDRTVTSGFSHWSAPADHFVIFTDVDARDIARNFVISALNGSPELRKGEPDLVE